jgi:hypothetical protein
MDLKRNHVTQNTLQAADNNIGAIFKQTFNSGVKGVCVQHFKDYHDLHVTDWNMLSSWHEFL